MPSLNEQPPTDQPPRRSRPARRAWRLLTTRGRLAVHACALCAALVLDTGRAQHERSHAADRRAS